MKISILRDIVIHLNIHFEYSTFEDFVLGNFKNCHPDNTVFCPPENLTTAARPLQSSTHIMEGIVSEVLKSWNLVTNSELYSWQNKMLTHAHLSYSS